jgi:hypothetical protein
MGNLCWATWILSRTIGLSWPRNFIVVFIYIISPFIIVTTVSSYSFSIILFYLQLLLLKKIAEPLMLFFAFPIKERPSDANGSAI